MFMDKDVTTLSGKTSRDLDQETHVRIHKILKFIDDNPWFNEKFIYSIMHQRTYSIGQRQAVKNIYEKFVKGKEWDFWELPK